MVDPITRNFPDDAPVHTLADDTLLIIFEYLDLPGHGPYGRHDRPDDVSAWVVSWVCRRWRELAVYTPSLWTAVSFYPPRKDLSGAKFKAMDLQLERTKQCALDIYVSLRRSGWAQEMVNMCTIQEKLKTLLLLAPRFRALALFFDEEKVPGWMLSIDRGHEAPTFTILRTLTIGDSDASWSNSPLLSNTPALTDLTLDYSTFASVPQLSFGNLQCLKLINCRSTAQTFLALLQLAAPRLQVLVLLTMWQWRRAEATTAQQSTQIALALPVVELPERQELVLGNPAPPPNRDDFISEVVSQLRMPTLRQLRLDGTALGDGLGTLTALPVSQTFPNMMNITVLILNVGISEHERDPFITTLSQLEAIEVLTLNGPCNRWHWPRDRLDFLLEKLQYDSNVSELVLCPRLTTLDLGCWRTSPELLEAMIRSRTRGPLDTVNFSPGHGHLRKISLDVMISEEPAGGGNLDWLDEMLEQGVLQYCTYRIMVPPPTDPNCYGRWPR